MRALVVLLLLAGAALAEHPGQWNLETTGLAGMDLRADGVVVAVLDSGIDMRHPDLPTFWMNADEVPGNGLDDDLNGYVDDVHGWDTCDDAPATDHHGTAHGTAVAGVIAADGHVTGIAPGASIMHVRVLCGMDWGDPQHELDPDALKDGIRYAVDNGAKIVVMSLQKWADRTPTVAGLLELEDTFEYAHSEGVLLVAAAGNFGKPGLSGPANQPHMFAVSATMACEWPAPYSNRGGHIWAPGTAWTTVPRGHAEMDGTSFAAPLVAGAAALLLADDPTLSPDDLKQRILESARATPAGPMLDGALFAKTYTAAQNDLFHPATLDVGNIYHLELGHGPGPLPAFIALDVEGNGRYCYSTQRMVDDSFYFAMRGLLDEQRVQAAFYDRGWSGNMTFTLIHDPSIPDTDRRPMLVPVEDAGGVQESPLPWALALVVLAFARRLRC